MSSDKTFFSHFPGKTLSTTDVEKVFLQFDANKDGLLDKSEVQRLVQSVATNGALDAKDLDVIFAYLDFDNDGAVSPADLQARGPSWLSLIFCAPAALVVVDVQNDFITGSLALSACPAQEDGADVVQVINDVIDRHAGALRTVVYSFDWHPADHISFLDNLHLRRFSEKSKIKSAEQVQLRDTVVLETAKYGPIEQIMWPRHCVQNTDGAKLHPDLKVAANHLDVFKGMDPDIDSYSAFWDNGKVKQTDLFARLCDLGVRDVVVCGLATDVCVGSTAAHAQEHGFRTALLVDACRGVLAQSIADTKARLTTSRGLVLTSQQLGDILSKRERPMPWVVAAVDCARKLCGSGGGGGGGPPQ